MARILVVDDDPQVREFVIRTLMKDVQEHEIMTARDGIQALEITGETIPDLIITDWEMPGLSGLEIVQRWKNGEETREIPIIMCTGIMTDTHSLSSAFEAGVIDFLRKPVDESELLARVTSMLRFQNLQRQKWKIEKEKLELELYYRQQEASNYILQLTQKNEFLSKIKEQLQRLNANELREVISSIDFNIENSTWSDLNLVVSRVEPGFLERLEAMMPDLTTNDIRLCSLIRLRLSVKEAAQLLNISHDSIMKSRYRLKKKFAPDSEQTLEQIIFSV